MSDGPSIAGIERASLATWPALETVANGPWRARFARGHTKRANSIVAVEPDDALDARARLRRLAEDYRARGLAPVFRLNPLAGRNTRAALDAEGWTALEESLVLVMPAATGRETPPGLREHAPDDPSWLTAQARMNAQAPASVDTLALMLARLREAARAILLRDGEGKPFAAALVAVSGSIAFYYNVVVDAGRRGRGHGRALMVAALDWAERNGAAHHAIQVVADNAPALGLYRALGFVARYPYSYRRAPQ